MGLTVDITHVEEQWRPIPDDQEPQVNALIKRAIALLRVKVPSLDRRVDLSEDLMEVARGVVVDMIKRATPTDTPDNGGGQIGQRLEVAGPFTNQVIYKTASSNLYVLDKEIADLSPQASAGVGTIFTHPCR